MSKVNSPIRFRKMVNGYKTIRKIKGTSDTYSVTTNSAQTTAQVLDSTNTVISEISDIPNVRSLVLTLQEGFKSLGAVFPNLITKNVPFVPVASSEVQSVTLSPVPNTGSYRLKLGPDGASSGPINYNATEGTIQTRIAGLSAGATVDGDNVTGYEVTFAPEEGNVPLLEVAQNILGFVDNTKQTFTFSSDRSGGTGQFRFYDSASGNYTAYILPDDTAGDIEEAIQALYVDAAVTEVSPLVLEIDLGVTLQPGEFVSGLQDSDNTLKNTEDEDITITVTPTTPSASIVITIVEETPGT